MRTGFMDDDITGYLEGSVLDLFSITEPESGYARFTTLRGSCSQFCSQAKVRQAAAGLEGLASRLLAVLCTTSNQAPTLET